MPELKPQTAFLLRGSALLIGLLTLWNFALQGPMLQTLQAVGDLSARIVFGGKRGEFMRETSPETWTFRVPLGTNLPASPQNPTPRRIDSIDFDLPRPDVSNFTFSLPMFWAIALAAPGWRRNLRPLLIGTGVLAVVELIFLLVFARTWAQKVLIQLSSVPAGPLESWLLRLSDYMTLNVLPFAAPFAVIFTVHADLRRAVFGWAAPASPEPQLAEVRKLRKTRVRK